MPNAPSNTLLGRTIAVTEEYSPQLLQGIPRADGRSALGVASQVPFNGEDIWHAYEISWLDASGKPEIALGRFHIPADSPNIVESKSLKLYLHSLNLHVFESRAELQRTIGQDVSHVIGVPIGFEALDLEDASFQGRAISGECIDRHACQPTDSGPEAKQLVCFEGQAVDETLHSHLLRSLCPVTGQPDWASVVIRYKGLPIDRGSLLSYIIAYRRHQEFHEQCVERMFVDIQKACSPISLSIQAFYTRRGGLDICPWRSSEAGRAPILRLNRQ